MVLRIDSDERISYRASRAVCLALAALLWTAVRVAGHPIPDPVPLRFCLEAPEWQRPTPAQMATSVWQDRRYSDPDGSVLPEALAYYEHHFILFTIVTASGVSHALDLTGLNLSPSPVRDPLCSADFDAGLFDQREVAVWVFGYSVLAADLTGDTLTVTVAPNATPEQGFSIIQLPRPQQEHWTVRFVRQDGQEVARAIDPGPVTYADEPAVGN